MVSIRFDGGGSWQLHMECSWKQKTCGLYPKTHSTAIFFKERERERDRQNIPGIYRQNFGQGPGPCADIYRAKNVFVFFFLNDLNSNLIFFLNSIITRLVNTALARWINYLKFFLLIFFLRIFGGIFSDKGGNIEIYFLKKKLIILFFFVLNVFVGLANPSWMTIKCAINVMVDDCTTRRNFFQKKN